MSDYKRFVSYVYDYEYGIKRNNVGYARVEVKNGQCKITLSIKVSSVRVNTLKCHLFMRQGAKIKCLRLGDGVVKNGSYEFRSLMDSNNLMGSNYSIDEMGGIIVYSSLDKFFATEWDDNQIILLDSFEELTNKNNNNKIEQDDHEKTQTEDIVDKLGEEIQSTPIEISKEITDEYANEVKKEQKDITDEIIERKSNSNFNEQDSYRLAPEQSKTSKKQNDLIHKNEDGEQDQKKDNELEVEVDYRKEKMDYEINPEPIYGEKLVSDHKKRVQVKEVHYQYYDYYNRIERRNINVDEQNQDKNEIKDIEEREQQGQKQEQQEEQQQTEQEAKQQTEQQMEQPEHPEQEYQYDDYNNYQDKFDEIEKENSNNSNINSNIEEFNQYRNELKAASDDIKQEQIENTEETDQEKRKKEDETNSINKFMSETNFNNYDSNTLNMNELKLSTEEVEISKHIDDINKIEELRIKEQIRIQEDRKKQQDQQTVEQKTSGNNDNYQDSYFRTEARSSFKKKKILGESIVANKIFESYPKLNAFNDKEFDECVRIEPQDLGLFPVDNWILGNNSFLLHGYYSYRHLLFAEKKNMNVCQYLLGVPGVYQTREKFVANMFGFHYFKPSKGKEPKDGDFGYWYMEIKL
ncbi:DUF6128 domain-containing protein [Anaeromicropila herbilytica]|uniref:DUF6128 domain-containing protein n=1 Tax=Anaeromicropila herbilytica TaxID=2785025 RepID=A0A7R7IBG0_9FIRM|nr:DUF6128 domain-containing protein [Anaeromicropila herbilytica]BCN28744.1 hypothetical protein bsdtb5_00390 [Anaeromicropila herbilytica]